MIGALILLRSLLKTSHRGVLGIVAAALVGGASTALLLAVLNTAITGTNKPSPIAYAGLCLLALAAAWSSHYLTGTLTYTQLYELRKKLTRLVLTLPLERLEKLGGARIYASLTEDIPRAAQGMASIPVALTSVVTIAGALTYLLWVAPMGMVAWMVTAAIFIPIIMLLLRLHFTKLMALRRTFNALHGLFDTLLKGSKELRLGTRRRDDFYENGLTPSIAEVRDAGARVLSTQAFVATSGQLAVFAVIGVVLFLGSSLLGMAPAEQGAFVLVTLFILSPVEAVLGRTKLLGEGAVALMTINRLGIEVTAQPLESFAKAREPLASGVIELSGVVYNYKGDGEFALGPISAKFVPGKIHFVVGGNGSGKSTLMKLVTGLYQPDEGSVHIAGTEVTESNVQWFRGHFSTIFADYHLFDYLWGTADEALEATVNERLKELELSGKITFEGRRFSTTKLSAGQRRRLALIAALVDDRPVLLFDEWAADQDPRFRHTFYRRVLPELRALNKTIIVVSHDERYFDVADELIQLEAGKQSADHSEKFMQRLTGMSVPALESGSTNDGPGTRAVQT